MADLSWKQIGAGTLATTPAIDAHQARVRESAIGGGAVGAQPAEYDAQARAIAAAHEAKSKLRVEYTKAYLKAITEGRPTPPRPPALDGPLLDFGTMAEAYAQPTSLGRPSVAARSLLSGYSAVPQKGGR